MITKLKPIIIIVGTILVLLTSLVWHVHHTGHHFVVHFAYVVIVLCGLWKYQWLPAVTALIVVPHIVIDALYLRALPIDAMQESFVQVIVAFSLYVAMISKEQFASRYRKVIKETDVPFAHHQIITDASNTPIDYRFIDCNPAFEKLIGLKKAQLLGKRVLEVLPDTEAIWIKRYGDVALNGTSDAFESYSQVLDKWFRVTAYAPQENEFVVLAHDITDLREQANIIADNEARFEALTKQSKTIVYELSLKGEFTYVSSSVNHVLGYHPHELIGKSYENLFPARVADKQRETFKQRLKAHKRVESVETALLNKHKSIVWMHSNIIPKYDKKGKLIAYLGSDMDITKQKHTQTSLELFRTITEEAVFGSVITRVDGIIVYSNKAFATMLNTSPEALLNTSLKTLHGDASSNRIETLLNQLVTKGKFALEEITFKRSDGNTVPTIMSATPIYEVGKPKYLTATVVDISSRIDLQQALLESEKRYETVIDVSQTGVWEYNIETQDLWCSTMYFTMLGFDSEIFKDDKNTLKHRWEDLLHEDDRAKATKRFKDYIASRPNTLYENRFRMKTKSGTIRWIYSRGDFIRHADANYETIVGTHIDITDQVEQEAALHHAMHHDQLTGLFNRQYYYNQTTVYDTQDNYPLAFVFMDINGLKVINDAYGLEAGNEVIKNVSRALVKLKPKRALIARLGGDEFGMLVPKASIEQLESFKTTLKSAIEAMPIHELEYSLAIGYEFKKDAEDDTDEIVMTAENHMYRNKTIEGASIRNRAVMSILKTLTDKYEEEKVHSERVARYCKKIGEALALDDESIRELELAGLLHDIGKISVPDAILNKAGPLNDAEWKIMKDHTVNGYQILHAADEYSDLADYALSHHERIDGSGYPNGLKGDTIPFFARIISVVDAYEAMTSNRPYRKAMKPAAAKEELKKHAETQFDKTIVNLFVNHVLDESKLS